MKNDELAGRWDAPDAVIAYIDVGKLCLSSITEFLPFCERHQHLIRIDCDELEQAFTERLSGALTASGTMAVCARMGIPLAVAAGMGGIGNINTESMCPDLPALCELPVALLATAPKDMLDYKATFDYLRNNEVQVLGIDSGTCDGFMFVREKGEKLDGVYSGQALCGKLLLLNGLVHHFRMDDITLLDAAIHAGVEAEACGEYYHPAVNKKLDELSDGKTSLWQLQSLLENIRLAEKITKQIEGGNINGKQQ